MTAAPWERPRSVRPMGITVRTIDDADVTGWIQCMRTAFLTQPVEGEAEYRRTGMDLDRSWGAFDGEKVVGTLRSFATTLTVPGPAEIGAAALTNVTVAPTHRRRGLLTEMITSDLRDSAERGEAVGILIASEYPIYGRFGYGAAVEAGTYSVDASHARFRRPGIGTVELVDLGTLRREAPPVYEQFRAARPGAISRRGRWWDQSLRQVEVPGADPPTGYQAIYRSEKGRAQGYLRYRATEKWELMRPDGLLTIDELVGITPEAYHRLWEYCCEIDLITSIEAGDRSVDEPLVWLLEDGRVLRQTGRFYLVWVLPPSVATALATRRYLTDGQLVMEVVDPLGFADGRYVLDGGPAGATCTKTTKPADLSLGVDALGSIYLGGVSLRTLAAAGRVDEHRVGAVATADTMFRSAVTPWCTTWF
jgi:predicted acetyltransferase